MNQKYGLFLLCCWLCSSALFAQKYAVWEWGVIPESDLKITGCPWDSSATALVLQDAGKIKLQFGERGPEVVYTRSKRIKLFDPSAFDEGNLRIVYRSNRQAEKFEDLDVQLILPDGTRKKVKSDNIFTEKITESRNAKKVFIPNLQKGCIIEYRYKLRSTDYITLYDWYFQEELPVRWSQVEVSLPEHSEYTTFERIPKEYDLHETRIEKPELFSSIQHNNKITTYGLGEMQALKDDEPFITTVDDYRAHIWFQKNLAYMAGIDSLDWNFVAKGLQSMDDFGLQYADSTANPKIWAAFQKSIGQDSIQDSLLLVEKALQFVGKNIKWNGVKDLTTNGELDNSFTRGFGSSADINLSVVALLRRMGIKAAPMLISTRSHGEPIPQFPYIPQFNMAVAFAQLGKDTLLLDATDPFHAINQLDPDCYNRKGWVVQAKEPFWTKVQAPEESAIWYGDLALNETGEMRGKFTISLSGETALLWRHELEKAKDKDDFVKKQFAFDYPETVLDSVVYTNLINYEKPLQMAFKCTIPNAANAINDFLYVKPVITFLVQKNPLTRLSRTFPINFGAPTKGQYVLNLTLPKGYVVEELPESARISLPDNGGKIQFSCSRKENHSIQVLLKMNISKLDFNPEEYGIIRQFFEMAAEKSQLQLVLKKG